MSTALSLTPTAARRLAIAAQSLDGRPRDRSADGPATILGLLRDIRCVQIDPIQVVARTHRLVLWSRLGPFDPADLDHLLWEQRTLFEYWAHAASIVLTEDYPLHSLRMRRWGKGTQAWERKIRAWIADNQQLRRHVLSALRRGGPIRSRDFKPPAGRRWESTGWTAGREVSLMLNALWAQGKIMVAGRIGQEKLWDLTDRVLPGWAPRDRPPAREATRRAAELALRALGVARPAHIREHFLRGWYQDLPDVLAGLERAGRIVPVEIRRDGTVRPGRWFVHVEDLPRVERIRGGDWEPRTTLLSPFDNLICDRARTRDLFGFDFSVEIYVPPAKRKYGFYVMPILHGDRLIGRIDPEMDRRGRRLVLKSVHMEPDAPRTKATGRAVAAAIEDLAGFLGAGEIRYPARARA